MFPRGEEERERCCGKCHGLVWAGLKARSPKAASSPFANSNTWLAAPVLMSAFLACRALLPADPSSSCTFARLVLLCLGLWAG